MFSFGGGATFSTTSFGSAFGGGGSSIGSFGTPLAAEALRQDAALSEREARLRIYCPASSGSLHGPSWDWTAVRQRMLSLPSTTSSAVSPASFSFGAFTPWQETAAVGMPASEAPASFPATGPSCFLPHAVLRSSALCDFFQRAPPDFFQLNHLSIATLPADDGADAAAVSAQAEPRGFSSPDELAAFFHTAALSASSRRLRVRGRLCGDAALLAEHEGRLSSVVFAFDCRLLQPVDAADLILDLTREMREKQPAEQLTKDLRGHPLCRHASLQDWWTQAAAKEEQQQRPYDSWQQRDKRVAARWAALTEADSAQLGLQYDAHLLLCDAHDAQLKQRWLDGAAARSPGVRPVGIAVDDDSIRITASYSLRLPSESQPGFKSLPLPMVGRLDGATRVNQQPRCITFTVDAAQPVDEPPACPLAPLFTQQGVIARQAATGWQDPGMQSVLDFLQRFGGEGRVRANEAQLSWQLSSCSELSSRCIPSVTARTCRTRSVSRPGSVSCAIAPAAASAACGAPTFSSNTRSPCARACAAMATAPSRPA